MNIARILLPVVFVLAVSGRKVLERKFLGGLVPVSDLLTIVVIALIVWVLRDEIPSPFRGTRRRVLIATVVLLGLSLGPFALLDQAIIRATEEIFDRRISMEWIIAPVYAPLQFVGTVLGAAIQELLFTYLTQEILTRLTGRKWIAWITTALIFTAYHADPDLEGVFVLFPFYFVSGLIYAGAYRITGNLIPTIVTHSVGNVVATGEIYLDAARYFLEKLAGS